MTDTGSAPDPAPAPAPGGRVGRRATGRLGYQPGLDGLRGVALLAIFVFHAGFDFAPGAFLSVSTFFTLSGFLITYLLLEAYDRAGRVDQRAFWARRFRRLLPASLLTIAAIVVVASVVGDANQLSRLRGDVVAALAYVANWRFIAQGDAYGALFTTKSPMQHFWSLAIEEQFYLLYPVVLAAVLWVGRGSRKVLALVLGGATVLSLLAGLALLAGGAPVDRLYFGTDFRVAELLVGALLAVWWGRRRAATEWLQTPTGSRVVTAAGAVAVVAMLWLWHVAQRTDAIWYHGGLIAYSVLTAVVIVAALHPSGPVRRVLGARPLVAIGLVSYGAYLIHWPVFVWVGPATGLASVPLFALRIAVTFALATVVYLWVERPIRSRAAGTRPGPALAIATVVVIVIGTFAVTSDVTPTGIDFAAAQARYDQQRVEPAAPGTSMTLSPDQAAALDAMYKAEHQQDTMTGPRAAFFGDSTALMTSFGLTAWSNANGNTLRSTPGSVGLGCGLLETDRRYAEGVQHYSDTCRGWLGKWIAAAETGKPDVAVVQLGPWEVADTELPGTGDFRSITDPDLRALVKAKLSEAVDALAARVPKVLLLTSPPIEPGRKDGQHAAVSTPESDPARMDAWNQLVREVAAGRPQVAVVDFAAYFVAHPDADLHLRPDGIHLTEQTTDEVAPWLGPELARVAASIP